MTKKLTVKRKAPHKKVAVVKHVKIPAEVPVEGVVLIIAKPEHADTVYNHVVDWLKKAGDDIASVFK
jgi:hypothetical protein